MRLRVSIFANPAEIIKTIFYAKTFCQILEASSSEFIVKNCTTFMPKPWIKLHSVGKFTKSSIKQWNTSQFKKLEKHRKSETKLNNSTKEILAWKVNEKPFN